MPRISSKNQVTLPVETLRGAGLQAGDEVAIVSDGPGRIVVQPATRQTVDALGVFDGLYGAGYLDDLRGDWA